MMPVVVEYSTGNTTYAAVWIRVYAFQVGVNETFSVVGPDTCMPCILIILCIINKHYFIYSINGGDDVIF